jgi:hypothetical protein
MPAPAPATIQPAPRAAPGAVPALTLASVRTVNVTRRYQWAVERALTPAGPVSLTAGRPQLVSVVTAFRRISVPLSAVEHRASGGIDMTNPSYQAMSVSAVRALLSRAGAPNVTLPAVCGGSRGPFSIAPRETLRCTFDAAVGDERPAFVRAVALLPDGRAAISASGQALSFARAAYGAEGECALVTDDFTLQRAPSHAVANPSVLAPAAPRWSGERAPSTRLRQAPLQLCAGREFHATLQLGPFSNRGCGAYAYGGPAVARPTSGAQGEAVGGARALEVLVSGC